MDEAITSTLRIVDFPFAFVDDPRKPSERLADTGIKARFEGGAYPAQFMRMLLSTRSAHPEVFRDLGQIEFPSEVAAANREYKEDNNTLLTTLAEWLSIHYDLTVGHHERIKSSVLMTAFACSVGTAFRVGTVAFKRAMDDHGVPHQRVHNGMMYCGIRSRADYSFREV